MEITREQIKVIAKSTPGVAGIFCQRQSKLEALFLTPELAALCGMDWPEFQQLMHSDVLTLLFPEDRARLLAAATANQREGAGFTGFYLIRHKHLGVDMMRVTARCCGTLEGCPVFVAVFANISTSSGIFINILENMAQNVLVFSKQNKKLLYANRAARQYFAGFQLELKNITCHAIFHDFASPCKDCIADGMTKAGVTWEGFSSKYNTWLSYKMELVPNEDVFIVYLTDISAQKRYTKNYLQIISQLVNMYPQNLGSFRLNLTKNLCLSGQSKLEFVLKQKDSGTADGYFAEFFKLLPAACRQDFARIFNRENLLREFEQGHTKISKEYSIAYPDGMKWREAVLHMLQNPFSGDVEAMTFALDINERKHKELIIDELVGSDMDFFSLLNLATEKITEYGERGCSYAADEKLCEVDYTPAMKRAIHNFVAEEAVEDAIKAHSIENIRQQLSTQSIYRVNFPTRDNRVKAWRMSYLNGDKNLVLIARRDITESVQKEREQLKNLNAAKLRAQRANEAKSTFLSGMSHDLRTPLNGIIGFTELALKADKLETKQNYLEKIKISGDLLLDLVNDTLELSRIESGKLVLKPEPVDGRDFWSSVVTALIPAAAMRNITLETDAASYPGEMILVDQLKVKKVFLNIISNAIKYTPDGGHVKVEVLALDPPVNGCTRRLIVQDNGIGMSPEFMERMFEPFTQEKRPEMANTLGTGLGLSIVKRTVDLMQGYIKVESKLNKGSRFTVDLPLEHWEKSKGEARQKQDADYAEAEQRVLCGRQVLLCEDNYLNAEIAKLLLKDKKIQVDWVKNGREGVTQFAASLPGYYDAILMDLRMPVMDGYEATRKIRALSRADAATVPIIAMTADAFDEDIKSSEEVGMTGYVTKPIGQKVLYKTLYRELTKER